jgi:cytochrome c peroxidase
MKKLVALVAISTFFLLLNAFASRPASALEKIQTAYFQDLQKFEQSLHDLQAVVAQIKPSAPDTMRLRNAFYAARLSYKKIAWLIGYLEPETEQLFNGAPIPDVELLQYTTIEARGFQPTEEIIFGDAAEIAAEMPQLKQLTNELSAEAQRWHEQMNQTRWSDRQILEAFRVELVQLFTQSLTGFDSPVAFHSLPEALVAWTNLENHFAHYLPALTKTDVALSQKIETAWSNGKNYLAQHQNFDSFDRMAFFKQHLQPLYADLVAAQRAVGVEFYKLTGKPLRAWNDEATNIFAKNFIQTPFYSQVKKIGFEDTPERIELGRLLFFDPIMSGNGKRSCASCHRPDYAYAEPLAKSLDLDGKPLTRNAPSLLYSATQASQFWDGRAQTVEEQMFHVAANPREMGNIIAEMPARIARSAEYVALFEKAFPRQPDALRIDNIQKAIGAFLRALPTYSSDFDAFMRGETTQYDVTAQEGFNLFMGKAKCGTCHFAPNFNGTVPPQFLKTEYEVLGVPNEQNQLDSDLGKYNTFAADKFRHAFKTVTARNAARTAPYMHNGRYLTLKDLLIFYKKGGSRGLGFTLDNQTLPFDNLDLNDAEMNALVRFMETLTDKKIMPAPTRLPAFGDAVLDKRIIGGAY